jgi:hypothetical protein
MSQKFNFMGFPRRDIMNDLPRNKQAILFKLQQEYELNHPKVYDESKCDLGWLCDTLIQTYNTSVLDLSDSTFKDACVEQAYKCVRDENRESKRTVLSQLILNHSKQDDPDVPKDNKKPVVDFIGGPLSLTLHWSKKYKKLIYIFGEKHDDVTDCENFKSKKKQNQEMLIEDYLEQLFKNTDVFIDFYLETDRIYQDIYGVQRIPEITKRFKKCFYNPNENIIDCKLSRMHYFDVRKGTSDLKPNSMSYASYMMYTMNYRLDEYRDYPQFKKLTRLKNMLDRYKYNTQIKPILEEFSKINIYDDKADEQKYAEYDKFWDTQIEEHDFVVKKVVKSTIHDKIKSFIKKQVRNPELLSQKIDINQLIKTVKDFIDTLNKYKKDETYTFKSVSDDENVLKIREEDFKKLLELDFSESLIYINSFISTDYYLLSRIFKKFNLNPDDPTKKRTTDEPIEPHNIIIYAGHAHSELVRKFLKELDFKDISKTSSASYVSNCIDMRSFPQPFFSNHRKVKWSDELPEEFLVDNKVINLEEEEN